MKIWKVFKHKYYIMVEQATENSYEVLFRCEFLSFFLMVGQVLNTSQHGDFLALSLIIVCMCECVYTWLNSFH